MKILKVQITDQECYDILTNGIETHAIDYWALDYELISIWRNKTGDITRAKVTLDDPKTGEKVELAITPATIRKGAKWCLDHGHLTIDDPADPDFDSDDDDLIIQAGLFGEIIFG